MAIHTSGILFFILIIFYGVVFQQFLERVKHPFIDEYFHVNQCLVYCEYKFNQWDPKITTPPGLYYLGFIWAKMAEITGFSGINVLRSLNLFGGLVCLPIILYYYYPKLWVNIIALPLLTPYYLLFYTDIWSLILIVASLTSAKAKSPISSSILGFLSLWFRQTNIIWIGFIAVFYIDNTIVSSFGVYLRVEQFIRQTLKNWVPLISYVANFLLFGIFVKINGGITLGDKENHHMQLHLVQIFYNVVFINFFTWPNWFSFQKVQDYKEFCIRPSSKYSPIFMGLNIFLGYIIHYIIVNFTIVHPFLLADNRHYTFYIWKRILSKPYSQWIAVPIYHFGSWNIIDTLRKQSQLSFITVMTFILGSIITIVPSPLFEPRYYITSLILFQMFTEKDRRVKYQFLWSILINIAIMWVFFNHEFTWQGEVGIQRIIW